LKKAVDAAAGNLVLSAATSGSGRKRKVSMKEVSQKNPVQVRRCGYAKSGFVFYFVRCRGRKALAEYLTRLPDTPKYTAKDAPYGYCHSHYSDTLGGDIIPEAYNGRLFTVNIVVAACGLTPREERRHWYHEIGHAVAYFRESHACFMTEELGENDFAAENAKIDEAFEEAPAMCNEFLCECLDIMQAGRDDAASSGLPFVMPWLNEKGTK
jgi:hypothetical protein